MEADQTFERVVVQNILHGLSPSLSDAIGSIPRWRFIRATFPHVVQCCASLLREREQAIHDNEEEALTKLPSSIVKLLYILHWMVLDSAAECQDAQNNLDLGLNQSLFPVSCIQIFVYLLAPLIFVLRREDISEQIRLESGLELWDSLWEARCPGILCFAAPVKPNKCQVQSIPLLKNSLPAAHGLYVGTEGATDQGGIYLGEPEDDGRRKSMVPSIPRPPPQLLSTDSLATQAPSLALDNTSPRPTAQVSQQPSIRKPEEKKKRRRRGKGVEGRKSSEFPLLGRSSVAPASAEGKVKKKDFEEHLRFVEEGSSQMIDVRDKAPLVQLHDICGYSFELENFSAQCEVQCERCGRVLMRDGNVVGTCRCERKRSSQLKIVPLVEENEGIQPDDDTRMSFGTADFAEPPTLPSPNGDEYSFSVGVTSPITSPSSSSMLTSFSSSSELESSTRAGEKSFEDSTELTTLRNQSEGVPTPRTEVQEPPRTSPSLTSSHSFVGGMSGSAVEQASYFDVAVIRCLFIPHWPEEGVHWALKYIYQRLLGILAKSSLKEPPRKRSYSVPAREKTMKLLEKKGSKSDLALLEKTARRPLTWQDVEPLMNVVMTEKKTPVLEHHADGKAEPKSADWKIERRRSIGPFRGILGGKDSTASPKKLSVSTLKSIKEGGNTRGRSAEHLDEIGRSNTDSNISYGAEFMPEAIGSGAYIDKEGRLSLFIILKAVLSILDRELSLRVCEGSLNVLELLLESGLWGGGKKRKEATQTELQVVSACCEAAIRAYLYLGCPYGCNDSIKNAQADFLRGQVRSCLLRIQSMDHNLLVESLRKFVSEIPDVHKAIDFLHAFTGFCSESCRDTSVNNGHRGKGLSQLAERRAPGLNPSYKNHFMESKKGLEGLVVEALFRVIVSKLMDSAQTLQQPQNMGLFHDIRSLITYVQEHHGNPFRRVELSMLLNARSSKESPGKLQKQDLRKEKRPDSAESGKEEEDEDTDVSAPQTPGVQRDSANLRRGLFKKAKDKHEESDLESSPGTPRAGGGSSEDGIGSSSSPLLPTFSSTKKRSKLQMALNLFKSSSKMESQDETDVSESELEPTHVVEETQTADPPFELSKTPTQKRISFKSAAKGMSFGMSMLKSNRTKSRGSLDSENGDDSEREKAVTEGGIVDQLFIPPKQLVNLAGLKDGAAKFAFLLETCRPGSVPDAPLLAALLDLKSPVISRAVVFLECSYFVHRCNRGKWPEWIKSSLPTGRSVSAAGNALGNRGTPSGLRRANFIQRAAGKMFYQWADRVGRRLESMLDAEEIFPEQLVALPQTETERRQLRIEDDLEDFMDDGVVNLKGDACPMALKLLAANLLMEITAFLRETFQFLPRARTAQAKPLHPGWEKLRRWSVLSSTFTPSQHGSIHSIADIVQVLHPGIGSGSDRRISFQKDPQEESPHSSHSILVEDGGSEKRGLLSVSRRKAFGLDKTVSLDQSHYHQQNSTQNIPEVLSHSTQSKDVLGGNLKDTVIKLDKLKSSVSITLTPAKLSDTARKLAQGRTRLMSKSGSAAGVPRIASFKKRHSIKLKKKSPEEEKESDGVAKLAAEWRQKSCRLVRRLTRNLETPEDALAMLELLPPDGEAPCGSDPVPSGPVTPESDTHHLPHPSVDHSPIGPIPEEKPIGTSQASRTEEEESLMFKQFPWIKVLIRLSSSFNFICTHQNYCHPLCFERISRQSHRLMIALRKVYGEEFPLEGELDRRSILLENLQEKQKEKLSQDRKRTSSLLTTGVPRRESAMLRSGGLDRSATLHLKLIERLEGSDKEKEAKSGKKCHDEEVPVVFRHTPIVKPMLTYMCDQVHLPLHTPLSALLKAAVVLNNNQFADIIPTAWELLLQTNSDVSTAAAALFIISSVKLPDEVLELLGEELSAPNPTQRNLAIIRFYYLWRNRYHCWLKMEEGAHVVFKVPPPGIDFTLPSPPIGIQQQQVVDPPWMPHLKTRIQELTLTEEEDATSQTIMTMTRTRRKQKQELFKRATEKAELRKSEERQHFFLLGTAVVPQSAYEPALFPATTPGPAAAGAPAQEEEEEEAHQAPAKPQVPVAQPLFPSCLLSMVPRLVELLDDSEVDAEGVSVSEIAKKVVWTCLVEDPVLFLRHFLEKLTVKNRQHFNHHRWVKSMEKQELMGLLRKVLLQFPKLPNQTAFSLLNYLVGFIMYYLRQPCEGSQEAIGMALSLVWIVVPSVNGLYFKDLKQTLRKEQCDAALLVTANVPSTKKIVIHGPDLSSIPAQFPIHEETQFHQLLTDSLDFFNIPDDELNNYILVDRKSGVLHSPNSFVRDFYFFRRSFYPQLNMVHSDPEQAKIETKRMALTLKFVDLGKVLFAWNILRNSPENLVPQRVHFLHEEMTRLASFPRKALETCFGMYEGQLGEQLHGMDMLHKYGWTQMMKTMFNAMDNPYMFGDLHIFINVLNGVMILHCEEAPLLRLCMAVYLNLAIHFRTLFSSNGFFLIMPTILRSYAQRQTNFLLCSVIEFICKQFYILHRKPFLLQMFGSIANILDKSDAEYEFDPMKIKPRYLFNLLLSLEQLERNNDDLDILGLVDAEKPLKAIDLCYKDDPNLFQILTDVFSSCITICAYAPESRRSYQMMVVMNAILPHYFRHIQEESNKAHNSSGAVKHEIHIFSTLILEMKALINSCDVLARAFSGPQKRVDIVNVGSRGKSIAAESPQFFDAQEESLVVRQDSKKPPNPNNPAMETLDDIEVQREVFRKPRDALLQLAATFLRYSSPRLKDLGKILGDQSRIPNVLEHKSHMKLSEIALSLLKMAPYDANTMAGEGLQKYFLEILPVTDWSIEHNRSALSMILRRLDKTFSKIGKKGGVRKRANWDALSNWLNGLYNTLTIFPYMAHLHSLKTTVQMCLRILIGDTSGTGEDASLSSVQGMRPTATILSPSAPPPNFTSAILKMLSFMMQALGEQSFSLEYVCSAETLGGGMEKTEALLCQILIPLFLRAGTSKKDAPQLKKRDLDFCLSFLINAVNPPASKSLGPAASLTANVILRGDTVGRQGSVSVAERSHSATVSTPRFVRDSVYNSVFLALKVMITTFENYMDREWGRIAKLAKDLALKRAGGPSLWGFLDFVVSSHTPLGVFLIPVIQQKMLTMKPQSDIETQWHENLREKINSKDTLAPLCRSSVLLDLSAELKAIKEEFSNRPIDQHSRTPTLIGDLHSESGSIHSGGGSRRQSDPRRPSESRRLSVGTGAGKVSRLSPGPFAKPGMSPQESIQSPSGLEDSTIVEEGEEERSGLTGSSNLDMGEFPLPSRLTRHRSTIRLSKGSQRWQTRTKTKSGGNLDADEEGDAVELKPLKRGGSLYRRQSARSPVRTGIMKTASVDRSESVPTTSSPPPPGSNRERIVSFTAPPRRILREKTRSQSISQPEGEEPTK